MSKSEHDVTELAEKNPHRQSQLREFPYNVPESPVNPRKLDIDDLERVRRYTRLYGGCVSDALKYTGILNTVVAHTMRPLREHDTIAGRVLPVKWHALAPEVRVPGAEKDERANRWRQTGEPQKRMHGSIFPGCVLVFDVGGDSQAAHFGEMSCALARSRGCVGVVNSGMTRDVRYILKMDDFPYWSTGTTPNAYKMPQIIDINIPIYLRGHLTHYVIVNPGDFIFGDDDGLQIVPEDYVDEVLLKGEELLDFEDKERELIRSGLSMDELYEKFGEL